MKPELYEEVELVADVPAAELEAGDRAIVVDYLEHPQGGEMGAVLELSQLLDRKDYVVTVPVGAISALDKTAGLTGSMQSRVENAAELSVFRRGLNIFTAFVAYFGLGKRS